MTSEHTFDELAGVLVLVSVITPTHRVSTYLEELFDSLQSQTYSHWEWILYLNGGATANQVPSRIASDKRVKIEVAQTESSSIGLLKKNASFLASGEILVEVDHDDILTPDCLEKIKMAYDDEEIDFVYSDCAYLQTHKPFIPHNPIYGWTWYQYFFNNKSLTAMKSFAPSSHAMSYIWWAPNHVRTWRKSSYFKIGGHNPDYPVCDDHEIMIKSYLAGKMKHLSEVLYIYRVDGNNTVYSKNALIQDTTRQLNLEYVRKLAVFDAKILNKLAIHVTCNAKAKPEPGFQKYEIRNQDIFSLDFPESSVYSINLTDILHYFSNPIEILNEIFRVLDHGGWAFIDSPADWHAENYSELNYKSFWNHETIKLFTRREFLPYIPGYEARFMVNRLEEYNDEGGVKRVRAFLNAIKKDYPRFPGAIE